jgi:DNA (cytosine-5)-methyltransferase 1
LNSTRSPIAAIGLFSGAGGLDLGAAWAGCDLRLSIDNDAMACATLGQQTGSLPGSVLQADVASLQGKDLRRRAGLSRSQPCIVVGGPPCQPFSKNAYWTDPGTDSRYRRARSRGQTLDRPTPILQPRPDARRSLVQQMWRLITEMQASAFLFENVPAIAHPRNRPILHELLETAGAAGYGVRLLRVNAVDYGVPQARQRIALLGLRGGMPPAPTPTHGPGLAPVMTAGVALEPFQANHFAEPEEVVRGRWAGPLAEIPPGWNYKYLTAWAGHPQPLFEAETRFWHFLLKLHPDRPSWTIPATPGPWVGPFHWSSRRLRTVELAALQGFPAGYTFAGTRRDRVRQIGNAVPPLLAQRLIEPLVAALQADGARKAIRKIQASVS